MELLLIILIAICWLSILLYTWFMFRFHKVCKFRDKVFEFSCEWTEREMSEISTSKHFYHWKKLPPYHRMVWSIKPLKLKTYFTDKEIKELLDCK